MNKKINLGLFFGGSSSEHEISVLSANNIYHSIDKNKYKIFLLGIDKLSRFFLVKDDFFNSSKIPKELTPENTNGKELKISLGKTVDGQFFDTTNNSFSLDLAFPALHGVDGEDGSLQGLLQLMKVPYVGCKILSSALSIDKDICKQILKQNGIKVTPSITIKKERHHPDYSDVKNKLGGVVFVKPTCQGSSVGTSKVSNSEEYKAALKTAFDWGNKVLIEQAVDGKEVECSVLSCPHPKASLVGEVVTKANFYSYEVKYKNLDQATIEIPAKIESFIKEEIQQLSLKIFNVLECSGLARCDFFLTKENHLYLNEVNTLPGFTKASHFPKMWEASGVSNTEVINQLLELTLANN